MNAQAPATMHELEPAEFGRAAPLFDAFDYSLSIRAAIEGNNPGRIFVDDAHRPRTALALTVEGYLLAGAHDDPATLDALRRLFRDRIFSGQVFVDSDESMSLAVHPEAWEARLPELIPTHEIEKDERYHYLCHSTAFDWRASLPEGYAVRRVDAALLDGTGVAFPDPVGGFWDIEEMWRTWDNFLARGASFCVVHEGQVVAWCTSDCTAGDQIDVGIVTHPAHRRRGLAAVAVAATVEHCLERGFRAVGWHCNVDNVASWKTAEKVGFRRNREYAYYYYVYDPIDHLAELGWHYYQRGEYARTVDYCGQVFARRQENPDYYYHLMALAWAALGDGEQAFHYLEAAVDRGWADAGWTKQQEAFAILQGSPRWAAVLARMEQNAAAG